MKKILFSILAIVMGGFIVAAPVFADSYEQCTITSVLGNARCDKNGDEVVYAGESGSSAGTYECYCDKTEKGDSVKGLLNLVVDILTIGVGIVAVIGIGIFGIQYLTSAGNEEKTRKAKRRLFEIVIGLAIYVVFFALLKWLGVSGN